MLAETGYCRATPNRTGSAAVWPATSNTRPGAGVAITGFPPATTVPGRFSAAASGRLTPPSFTYSAIY